MINKERLTDKQRAAKAKRLGVDFDQVPRGPSTTRTSGEVLSEPLPIYWLGKLPECDDFNRKYEKVMYDGKTTYGPWANMCQWSWDVHGCGKLGQGFGQKYVLQDDGRWLKVAG